jgi:GH3 auxin-responsive promoter
MADNDALVQAVAGTSERFRALLDNPRAVQKQVLQNILKQNEYCAFGLAHHFSTIKTPADYARAVPVSTYETHSNWINRVADGEANILTTDPVIAFEETGGSSLGRKLIPYTAYALQSFEHGLLPWLDNLFTHYPNLAQGRFYWAISPACRPPATTKGGIAIGMPGDAAYFGEQAGAAVVNALAVSPQVGQIADFADWRKATLLELLACENLTLISVWSPTFLTELLRYAIENRQALAQAINHRCELIEQALGKSEPDYQAIWPNLQVISCWDQASAKEQANQLRRQFPKVSIQGKGLLATECLVTIPLNEYEYPVLALESGFFEFIDAKGAIFLADQLQMDCHYQLLMTTASGLYRYAIGDEVRVRGFAKKTPLLEFVGRSNTTTDLCGEKLSDAFVMQKLNGLAQSFAMLAPAPPNDTGKQGYVLILDQLANTETEGARLANQLELNLLDNPQYSYARQLGQLDPVIPMLCDSPLSHWLSHRLAQGQRLGDIKVPALLNTTQWTSWARKNT